MTRELHLRGTPGATTRQARRLFGLDYLGHLGRVYEGLMASVGAGETNGRDGIMVIVERAEVLRHTELFSNLRMEDLAGLAALVEEHEYSNQEVLFDEGEVGHELFIIVEGRLEAVKAERTLFTADPGRTVGDLSLLDGLPTSYRAVAVKPTRRLVLGCEDFSNLLDERSRARRCERLTSERVPQRRPRPT